MPDPIVNPFYGQNLVDGNGIANQEFNTWMEQITQAVNNTPPLTGSGTPEGNIEASAGRWYVDTNASSADIYYKENGDGDTGWVITS